MQIRIGGPIEIDNLRQYPLESIEQLRSLLAAGADADPDPRRKGFYDVHNGAHVFYIHISPISGAVMLLARWAKSELPTSPQVASRAA